MKGVGLKEYSLSAIVIFDVALSLIVNGEPPNEDSYAGKSEKAAQFALTTLRLHRFESFQARSGVVRSVQLGEPTHAIRNVNVDCPARGYTRFGGAQGIGFSEASEVKCWCVAQLGCEA